ncbi:MAG: hypothetical protein ACUVXI_10710, partial [bacterium]
RGEMAQTREVMATKEDLTRLEGRVVRIETTMATREDLLRLENHLMGMEGRLTRKFVGWFVGFATFLITLYAALLYLVVMIWQKLL